MDQEILVDALRDDAGKIERKRRLINTVTFILYFLIGSYACLNWAGI